jgi:hypothetical protein
MPDEFKIYFGVKGSINAYDGDDEKSYTLTTDELDTLEELIKKLSSILFVYQYSREDEDRLREKFGDLAHDAVDNTLWIIHELYMAARFGKDSAFLP